MRYKVPRVFKNRSRFVASATISWSPGVLQWNTLLIDCSSHRDAHFSHWHIYSNSNGSWDNWGTRSQRVFKNRSRFVASATISWSPGVLQWNTLLINCSSHRDAHFSHWHICSNSNGSWDNWGTRSQRVFKNRSRFVASATISWNPGLLQWNTLLIVCSFHRDAHFSHWHICSNSNGSWDNWSTSSQRICYTRYRFVASATITWNPGVLQWKTLLIDCSSHRDAHFSHWHICSNSNGSWDNWGTRSQRVCKNRSRFVASATISWNPGLLLWNTLLIVCSFHRDAHFSHWHICSNSNGSWDNWGTRSQRVWYTR